MSTIEVGHTLLIEIVINWLCGDKGNCTFIISNWLRGLSKGQIMTLFMPEPWPESRQLEIVTLEGTHCGRTQTVVNMLTQKCHQRWNLSFTTCVWRTKVMLCKFTEQEKKNQTSLLEHHVSYFPWMHTTLSEISKAPSRMSQTLLFWYYTKHKYWSECLSTWHLLHVTWETVQMCLFVCFSGY